MRGPATRRTGPPTRGASRPPGPRERYDDVYRRVGRVPHGRGDGRGRVLGHAAGDAFALGLPHHRLGHPRGDGAQPRDPREEAAGPQVLLGQLRGQGVGGRGEHAVRHLARLGHQDAQAHAGEDEGVVALADADLPAVHVDRLERAAGGHQRPTARPGHDVGRPGLGRAGGVREREDRGALDLRGHRAHDLLAEEAGHAGDADEHGRLRRLHHVEERRAGPQAVRGGHLARPREVAAVLVLRVHHEALRVEHGHGGPQRLAGHALAAQRALEEPGDPDPRGAGARDHQALVGQLAAGGPGSGEDPGHRDRRRALDVVVEGRQLLPVALQQAESVPLLEVLPLQEGLGEALLHRPHELVHHRVVGLAPQPGLAPADVEVVSQQLLVVGADVEADGERLRGVDSRRGHVERELADRDAHASRPLVAEAEDALVVGDHDEPHVLEGGVGEHLGHAPLVLGCDPQAPRAPEDPAVLLAGLPHGGRVDDGEELLEVVAEHLVEEVLVAVLERGEADEALERLGLADDVAVGAPGLLLHRARDVGQQPLEPELTPLVAGEGGGPVVHGVVEQLRPAQPHLHALPPVRATLPAVRLHTGAPPCRRPNRASLLRPVTLVARRSFFSRARCRRTSCGLGAIGGALSARRVPPQTLAAPSLVPVPSARLRLDDGGARIARRDGGPGRSCRAPGQEE